MSKATDRFLQDALRKAYAARAKLFHLGVGRSRLRDLFGVVDGLRPAAQWDTGRLNITEGAFRVCEQRGIAPHLVFAHPDVIALHPELCAYYRNLVALSQKGMTQLGFPTHRLERNPKTQVAAGFVEGLCRALNGLISEVVESIPSFGVASARDVAFAEVGTEVQGTWANQVGRGASKAVEDIIADHVARNDLGQPHGRGRYVLRSGWEIRFRSEPDVAFLDPDGVARMVLEIKGSLDKAGAQTRYGEAKKTFAKALAANPRCHTVYLASCYTDAVVKQIKADGQVRETFNLTAILSDVGERKRFLQRLFYVINAPR